MMFEIRPAETEDDIVAFLAIRAAVDPEFPMTRESFDAERSAPGRLDVVALVDGEHVGCGFVERLYGDPQSTTATVSVRVLEPFRRRGIGTKLLDHVSAHAGELGATELHAGARSEAADLIAFYEAHRFVEVNRVQDLELDPAEARVSVPPPLGIELVALAGREDLEAGMHDVALESVADIPAARPEAVGSFERWRRRSLGPLTIRELSFVALEGGEVVGYGIVGRSSSGEPTHWMTGVRRDHRGRGIATALKSAQIAAAREAGVAVLRAQNDLPNAAMRRVNEKLGYRPRTEFVYLTRPVAV
jgi:GNAT superfamily N-acetyltransferase